MVDNKIVQRITYKMNQNIIVSQISPKRQFVKVNISNIIKKTSNSQVKFQIVTQSKKTAIVVWWLYNVLTSERRKASSD